MTRYVCRFCNAGGADGKGSHPPSKAFYNCHVCKKPNAMLPEALMETYGIELNQKDLEIERQAKRIVELENKLAELNDIYFACNCRPSEMKIYALEQQAKGVEDYVTEAMEHYWILHLNENVAYHNFLSGLNVRANKLRDQAKALRVRM